MSSGGSSGTASPCWERIHGTTTSAAIAGIVVLVILWNKGMLSRPVIIAIVSVVVIAVGLALFGRLRGGN